MHKNCLSNIENRIEKSNSFSKKTTRFIKEFLTIKQTLFDKKNM